MSSLDDHEEVARLIAEMAKDGKGVNSPEATRLRRRLALMDGLVERYERAHPSGELSPDIILLNHRLEWHREQLYEECKPYFDRLHRRYVARHRLMVIVGWLLAIALVALLLWIGFNVAGPLRVVRYALEDFDFWLWRRAGAVVAGITSTILGLLVAALGFIAFLAVTAGVPLLGFKAYERLYKAVTGYDHRSRDRR